VTPEERAEVLVTARLLRAARVVQWLALALIVLDIWTAFAPGFFSPMSVIAGLVALYFAVRVAFDARLFEDILADRLTTAQLDAALGSLRKGTAGRSWSDRCRGARRLVVKLMIATALQAGVLVLSRT
jgi:hypothetical protein